ncbi:MAG: DegQ family serine endoprotease [Duodenibacillus sp.]|nr:DegQ family serine endoprotease [Duodenibacillus sp.]
MFNPAKSFVAISSALVALTMVSLPCAAAEATGNTPGASVRASLPNFVDLVEQHGKGVVNISTVRAARQVDNPHAMPGWDERHAEIFRRFGFPFSFGGPRHEPERRGHGSGFIISADGLILTNHHVVEGADEITVRLTDKREFKGKVLGSDKKTDIAVIKIEASDLPVLKMGNSDALKVGEWVAAIGSPFGLDNTVTAGIVSAKSRKLPSDQFVPFIQTDVAVNPGNSGGPLFNMDGEVIGINSQIFSTSGGFMGLSFAIPIDLALQIKDQLVKSGRVTRGRIGVVIQNVTAELAESFGLKTPTGAIVAQIEKDGPAAQSGLMEGDVITAVDGKKVESSSDLPVMISAITPGTKVKLNVIRDGQNKIVTITVGEAGTQAVPGQPGTVEASALGVKVQPLSDEEKEKAGTEGVKVLDATGAAAKAGIRKGDIIVNINGRSIKDTATLSKVLEAKKNLRILVQRGSSRIFIPVRLK